MLILGVAVTCSAFIALSVRFSSDDELAMESGEAVALAGPLGR